MKKILCILLAAIMLLCALASCTETPENETDGATNNSTEGNTVPEDHVVIFEKEVETSYVIVCADDSKAATVSSAQGLAYQIKQKFKLDTLDCEMEYAEWGIEHSALEILIGNTTRTETAEAKKLLLGAQNEFAIYFADNGKIAIVGSSQPAVVQGINYFVDTFVKNNESGILSLPKGYTHYSEVGELIENRWTLRSPKYDGGVYAPSTYNIGTSLTLSSGNSGKMQLISETNLKDFEAYVAKLEAEGYTKVASNEINGNVYVQYKNDKNLVYAYYTAAFGEVRVIDDYFSNSEAEFEYTYEAKDGETTVYYQYGMMHDPAGGGSGNTSDGKWGNNGAFDIIKLADNKLILIDGGYDVQATPEATAALVDFLHEITGTKAGETITIAAWFMTHTHEDHLYFAKNIAHDYSDEFVFERIMHNTPITAGKAFTDFTTELVEKYPNILFAKLHTGQNITLGNINFDVIMTHEDVVDPDTGKGLIKDQNNYSTVLKFHVNGRSIMYFGDWGGNDQNTSANVAEYKEMERRLLGAYMAEDGTYPALKADIVQIAHHGINHWLGNVYRAVDADYAFFSQADVEFDKLMYDCYKIIIKDLRATGMEDKNMFFAGRQTNWLTIGADGSMTHGYKKIEGAAEDYWDYIEAYGGKPWYDYEA